MHEANYYRQQGRRARRLSSEILNKEIAELLRRVAQDYDELAEDIDAGAIEVRHPELMPQSRGG